MTPAMDSLILEMATLKTKASFNHIFSFGQVAFPRVFESNPVKY